MTTRKTLSVLFISLALAGVARPALAKTVPMAVAVAARTPAGAPAAGFTLRFLQGDKELAQCVTNEAGLCGTLLAYDTNGDGVVAAADGFTWGQMKNSIDGGLFSPGQFLALAGDGVGVMDQSSGAVKAQGVDWTQQIAVIVDAQKKTVSIDPDPAKLPNPDAVFVLDTPGGEAAGKGVAPSETPVPPTATPLSGAQAAAAPTETTAPTATAIPAPSATSAPTPTVAPTPTPAPATPDWPANGWLLALGAALIAGVLVMTRRKPKAQ